MTVTRGWRPNPFYGTRVTSGFYEGPVLLGQAVPEMWGIEGVTGKDRRSVTKVERGKVGFFSFASGLFGGRTPGCRAPPPPPPRR